MWHPGLRTMIMTLETTQIVPLTFWKDGSIRLKDSRLLLDMIVGAHNRGECPEEIYDSFQSDDYSVADIYAAIAYYLSNKAELDDYFAERTTKAESFWKKIESDPKHVSRIAQLKKFKELRRTE